jgi:hypothetical protein
MRFDRLDLRIEFALSTKARDVSTKRMRVSSQAATRLCAPEVKLSIAGTRPAACSAMKVTAAPLALGSITPIVSPGSDSDAIFRANTATAMRNMRRLMAPLNGSSTAALERPRVLADASNAACRVRRISNVRN